MAPLLDGTVNLKQRLDEVSSANIISDGQISQARDFRDKLKEVTNAVEGFSTWVGTNAVAAIDALIHKAESVGGPIVQFAGQVKKADDATGGWLGTMKDAAWDVTKDRFSSWIDPVHDLSLGFVDATDAVGALTTGFGLWGGSSDNADSKAKTLNQTQETARAIVQGVADEYQTMADRQKAAAETTAEEQKKTDALNASLQKQADAQKAAYDSTFAVKDAQDKLTLAVQKAADTNANAKATELEKNAADRAAQKAAEDLAVATAGQMDAQAAANGVTQTAADKSHNFVLALLATAQTMDPGSPLRQNLLQLADNINNKLPAEKRVDVNITADPTSLNNALGIYNALRDKTVKVTTIVGGQAQALAKGGYVDAAATGGPRSGAVLVGEEGPELVDLPGGSYVHTAQDTARMARTIGGGGGPGITVHINNPTFIGTPSHAVGAAVIESIVLAERSLGKIWRS
jgi:hypothetical protein